MKKTIFLIISILLLILAGASYGYLYYQNTEVEKELQDMKENVDKVQETINQEKEEITEKEDEYEKLKEKVKENLEELSIWEEIKESLNKSLS